MHCPVRSNTSAWGGVYFNVNVSIDGVWYNLGNKGYATAMAWGASIMDTWNYSQPFDFPAILGLTESYELIVELTVHAHDPVINVNFDVRANTTMNGLNGRGDVVSWASDRNLLTLNAREFDTGHSIVTSFSIGD